MGLFTYLPYLLISSHLFLKTCVTLTLVLFFLLLSALEDFLTP